MPKRVLFLLATLVVAGSFAPAGAACVATVDTHTAFLSGGPTIVATETTPAAGCDGDVQRNIVITDGPNSCASDAVADVVTDPFMFGGGPRSAPAETCGAHYALALAFAPSVPDPLVAGADASGPSGTAGFRKSTTVSSGTYATPWGGGTIPAGTPATLSRAVYASA